ncbi:MAG: RDD family protein [Mariprofundaceae bacterium]
MSDNQRLQGTRSGIGLRLLASCYDIVILFGICFLAFVPLTMIEQSTGSAPHWLKGLLFMAIVYGYFVGFWLKGGATTGMRPWKLRLAMAHSGDPITLIAASMRFFGLIITWAAMIITLLYLFGHYAGHPLFMLAAALLPALSLLCMMLSPRRQALHDLMAGTGVYRIKE